MSQRVHAGGDVFAAIASAVIDLALTNRLSSAENRALATDDKPIDTAVKA